MSIKSILISKRGHRCERCKLTVWESNSIPLEVHHIDSSSNNEDNLQLLCPNCHALTPNYRGKGIKTIKSVTDEEFLLAAQSSCNLRELLQKLSLVAKGGNYQRAKKRLIELDFIDKFQIQPTTNICICGIEIPQSRKFCSVLCSNRQNKSKRKIINRPSVEILTKIVDTLGYCATGRLFGVSDKAIRKWLVSKEAPVAEQADAADTRQIA